MFKFFILFSITLSLLQAAPAFSKNRAFMQEDGQTFKAKVMGDEYLNYLETEDGEIVVFNKTSKNYDYAIIANENNQRLLAPSGFKVQSKKANSKMRSNPFRKISKEELHELYIERKQGRKKIETH